MKIVPLEDRVVIKKKETEELASGILLTKASKEEEYIGEVKSIGEGKLMENGTIKPMKVKVGDLVCFQKFTGVDIEIDDEKLTILNESDILAILES